MLCRGCLQSSTPKNKYEFLKEILLQRCYSASLFHKRRHTSRSLQQLNEKYVDVSKKGRHYNIVALNVKSYKVNLKVVIKVLKNKWFDLVRDNKRQCFCSEAAYNDATNCTLGRKKIDSVKDWNLSLHIQKPEHH